MRLNTFSDIEIEKNRPGHKATFGNSVIRLSGSIARKTVVTDHTIQIHLPGELGLHDLNLIYNKQGQPNLPEHNRSGVYSLLTQKRHDLLSVLPIPVAENPKLRYDLKDGKFDLIATATNKKAIKDQVTESLTNDIGYKEQTELQLLRIWRTGEFFTYDNASGKLNKIQDTRIGRLKALGNAVQKFHVLPGIQNGEYSFDEAANYYKKYLIQDELENKFERQSLHHPRSFPDVRGPAKLQRRWSFASDHSPYKDNFHRRAVAGPIRVCDLQYHYDTLCDR